MSLKTTEVAIIITERSDVEPQLGKDWLPKVKLTIKNIRLDENDQDKC